MIVLDIGRRELQGKLQEILLVIFGLERGLNLSKLMVYLKCFVVKLLGEYFELYYKKCLKDLMLVTEKN